MNRRRLTTRHPAAIDLRLGDHVIWLYSPGRSFLTGWRLQHIHGVITQICRQRIRIKVQIAGKEKQVTVDPENVLHEGN
jgi:hypothetical protein